MTANLLGGSKSGFLVFELPATLETAAEAGAEHDLSVIVALRIDGRYYRWLDDTRDAVRLPTDRDLELGVEIEARREWDVLSLQVAFKTD